MTPFKNRTALHRLEFTKIKGSQIRALKNGKCNAHPNRTFFWVDYEKSIGRAVDDLPNIDTRFEQTCDYLTRSTFFKGTIENIKILPQNFSGVYFLIFENEVVYIGQSANSILNRLKQHCKAKIFTHWVASSISPAFENHLIAIYNPKYNVRGFNWNMNSTEIKKSWIVSEIIMGANLLKKSLPAQNLRVDMPCFGDSYITFIVG